MSSPADRYTRLPRSEYPAHVAAAIAIAESSLYRFSARVAALATVREFCPDSLPLRPAVVQLLEAGEGCAK